MSIVIYFSRFMGCHARCATYETCAATRLPGLRDFCAARRSCRGGAVAENLTTDWRGYAVLSAVFAAMTAIFGKLGVAEINSDLATFLRTIVVVALCACIVTARGEWQNPSEIAPKGMAFLVLSGLATGLSWVCYYRAMQTGLGAILVSAGAALMAF